MLRRLRPTKTSAGMVYKILQIWFVPEILQRLYEISGIARVDRISYLNMTCITTIFIVVPSNIRNPGLNSM